MPSLVQKLLLFSGGSAAAAYAARVLATSPLRYNKLNEASGTAIVDSSGNGYTGTYTGVTLADTDSPFLPDKAPLWDGVNDYGDLYSAAFGAAFNMDEFTVLLWLKASAESVWTDGTNRFLVRLVRDGTNLIGINKPTTNSTIQLQRAGGGTTKTITVAGQSGAGWLCYALSASVAGGGLLGAGELKAYKNGAQIGTTQTSILASLGSGLSSTTTTLGAAGTAGTLVWNGWLSRLIIWNRPIDAAILALMTP